MNTRDLSGKAVLVTGAGSGIGRATALEAARRGARVFVCDVDTRGLEETSRRAQEMERTVTAEKVDVSDAHAMSAFADRVHADVSALDILVNNAGVAVGARFVDTTLEDWRWIVDINLLGVVHGCHLFAPKMIERGRGHVVNIASMAGYLPTEGSSAYVATKFAVLGLSECMRIELGRHGVGVTAICPGFIDTPIPQNARYRGPLGDSSLPKRVAEIFVRRGYSPERVAIAIFAAIQRGRTVAPVTPESWAAYLIKRLSPGVVYAFGDWLGRRFEREVEQEKAVQRG
jgi:NAD(P)-dependent dehydrogenase (short-subunit alcohol dehydrogenase family)